MTLIVKNVSKSFDRKKILVDSNHRFSTGEIIGFVGRNGSGKTTFLKILCGILAPDKGHIYYDNTDIQLERNNLMGNIGTLFDSTRHLYWRLTALQNFIYFAGLKGVFSNSLIKEGIRLFDYFGIKNYINNRVEELSLGTKRKVAICCSLAHDPKFLFLDEPTNGLDVNSKISFSEYLKVLSSNQKLIIAASHDDEWINQTCTRIITLEK